LVEEKVQFSKNKEKIDLFDFNKNIQVDGEGFVKLKIESTRNFRHSLNVAKNRGRAENT